MGSNNLFNPMSEKFIKHHCLTRDRTQLTNPMSDKPIEPGFPAGLRASGCQSQHQLSAVPHHYLRQGTVHLNRCKVA
ncbi:hypothetical protein PCANC_13114 [Puccinia coronata f. sp. avenae]|uniref:Uncharacterized protein n=1 Tax=Puccinia coronata f. sp. avenae TaxID=200324 RepID=A0A2N5UUR5_9BASI|nr:hypothetical protein PCANC_21336 [Puccinia coronata f. sp. avenae]PLW41493.1 hypothetical protein PCANC_13114 [Puccinia coronata f. sp. avenae]